MVKNELIMLIGLPASGKSSLAKKYEENGYKIHSSDNIREELLGDVNNQENNNIVFKALHQRIMIDMELGNNVVYDATNLNMKKRRAFLDGIKKFVNYKKIAIVVATPYNECVQRDRERGRNVGYKVIDRMYKSFQFPLEQEGFDSIEIQYCTKYNFKLSPEYEEIQLDGEYGIYSQLGVLNKINQNNSNHTLTIGKHCKMTQINLDGSKIELQYAGLLHDFGKQKTISFMNSKGEYTNQAHYYGHECVSAYDAMFYMYGMGLDIILICQLINYHMRLYQLDTEKSVNKFKKFVGEEFYEMLVKINKADKEAK